MILIYCNYVECSCSCSDFVIKNFKLIFCHILSNKSNQLSIINAFEKRKKQVTGQKHASCVRYPYSTVTYTDSKYI